MAKTAWWVSQILLYVGVAMVGAASVLIGETQIVKLTGVVPNLGNYGIALMPYGVACVLSMLVMRNHANRACRSDDAKTSSNIVRGGIIWSVITAGVSWFCAYCAVIVLALLIH